MHPNASYVDGTVKTATRATTDYDEGGALDAVDAARLAQPGWWSLPPNSRSRRMFRAAVNLASARTPIVSALADRCGDSRAADAEFDSALSTIERWAIWTRKLNNVFGSVAPVAATTLLAEFPQPAGVVVAAHRSIQPFSSFVSVVAPLIAGGNAVVVVVEPEDFDVVRLACQTLTRSGVFAGIVNVIVGNKREVIFSLLQHADVGGCELSGLSDADRLVVSAAVAGHDGVLITESGLTPVRARSALAFLNLCDWPSDVASAPIQRRDPSSAPQPTDRLGGLRAVAEVRDSP